MSALFMLAGVMRWFAATRVGQIMGLVGALLIAGVIAYQKAKSIGRAEERKKIDKEIADHVNTKTEVDSDVSSMSDSDVDRELRKWTNDA